jgi:hypothetical protein
VDFDDYFHNYKKGKQSKKRSREEEEELEEEEDEELKEEEDDEEEEDTEGDIIEEEDSTTILFPPAVFRDVGEFIAEACRRARNNVQRYLDRTRGDVAFEESGNVCHNTNPSAASKKKKKTFTVALASPSLENQQTHSLDKGQQVIQRVTNPSSSSSSSVGRRVKGGAAAAGRGKGLSPTSNPTTSTSNVASNPSTPPVDTSLTTMLTNVQPPASLDLNGSDIYDSESDVELVKRLPAFAADAPAAGKKKQKKHVGVIKEPPAKKPVAKKQTKRQVEAAERKVVKAAATKAKKDQADAAKLIAKYRNRR